LQLQFISNSDFRNISSSWNTHQRCQNVEKKYFSDDVPGKKKNNETIAKMPVRYAINIEYQFFNIFVWFLLNTSSEQIVFHIIAGTQKEEIVSHPSYVLT
jgi:hypothetical protein